MRGLRVLLAGLVGVAAVVVQATIAATPAFAAICQASDWASLNTCVATIGGGSGTIQLTAPITSSSSLTLGAGSSVTLDLGGKRLSIIVASGDALTVGSALTVEDTVGGGSLYTCGGGSCPGLSAFQTGNGINASGATITVDSGSVGADGRWGGAGIIGSPTVIVNGGALEASGAYGGGASLAGHLVVNGGNVALWSVGTSELTDPTGSNSGTLTFSGGSQTIASGQTFTNNPGGVINFQATPSGTGTIANQGVIIVPNGGSLSPINVTGNNYTLNFNANYAGAINPPTMHVYGPTIGATQQSLAALSRTGYTGKWLTAGGTALTNTSALSSVLGPGSTYTITAHWTAITHKVTFNSEGGSAVAPETIAYNGHATAPRPPTRRGYTFKTWSSTPSGGAWVWSTVITAPRTLYAIWTRNRYTVGFDSLGGTAVPSQSVLYQALASVPTPPTKPGYGFGHWTTAAGGGAIWNWSSQITQSMLLYAGWSPLPQTVTFNSAGGSPIAPQVVYYGHIATQPKAPKRSGYTFNGFWVPTGVPRAWTRYDFAWAVTGPTTIWAQWLPVRKTQPAQKVTIPAALVLAVAAAVCVPGDPTVCPPTEAVLVNGTLLGGGSGAADNGSSAVIKYKAGHFHGSGSGTHHTSSARTFDSPSSLTPQIPNIYDVASQPERIGAAIAAGLVWTLLLMLATSSLDKVISSNYDSWLAALRRRFPRTTAFFGRFVGLGHEKTWLAIFGVFAMNAIVLDFVDPKFSLNWMSLRLLLSSTGALFVETLIPCLLIIQIARRRFGTAGYLKATPFGLLIGALGVIASRILGFLPGFMSGSTLSYDEPNYKTGEKIWLIRLKTSMVLGIGMLAWVGVWNIPKHGSALVLFARDAVVIVSASAFMSTALDLVPFAVFGGSLMFHHARKTWVAFMTISATGFFLLVVPQPHYWLFVGPRLLWWSIVASVVMLAAAALLAALQYKRTRAAA